MGGLYLVVAVWWLCSGFGLFRRFVVGGFAGLVGVCVRDFAHCVGLWVLVDCWLVRCAGLLIWWLVWCCCLLLGFGCLVVGFVCGFAGGLGRCFCCF